MYPDTIIARWNQRILVPCSLCFQLLLISSESPLQYFSIHASPNRLFIFMTQHISKTEGLFMMTALDDTLLMSNLSAVYTLLSSCHPSLHLSVVVRENMQTREEHADSTQKACWLLAVGFGPRSFNTTVPPLLTLFPYLYTKMWYCLAPLQ